MCVLSKGQKMDDYVTPKIWYALRGDYTNIPLDRGRIYLANGDDGFLMREKNSRGLKITPKMEGGGAVKYVCFCWD